MWESFWGQTLARWRTEGMPADADSYAYFGLDSTCTTSIDWTAQFPTEVIEDAEAYTILRNANGALEKRFKDHDATPHWWDFALTDRASWEEIRPRMQWNESRVNLGAAKQANQQNSHLFRMYMPATCGFEAFKYLMGMEGILIALAEDPDWALDMCMTTADMCIDGLEYLLGHGLEFDACFVTEDMGFKDKGFFSQRTYRDVIMPAQKKLNDACHSHGLKTLLHTCGMNMELVPHYIEAGYDVLNPMEVKAGMDIFELKRRYGDALCLWGGIDVRAIAHPDPAVLQKEIREKVTMAKQGGGYIFASDHSIPSDVSLARYQYMLQLARRYGTF